MGLEAKKKHSTVFCFFFFKGAARIADFFVSRPCGRAQAVSRPAKKFRSSTKTKKPCKHFQKKKAEEIL